jgi:hypothetical protein
MMTTIIAQEMAIQVEVGIGLSATMVGCPTLGAYKVLALLMAEFRKRDLASTHVGNNEGNKLFSSFEKVRLYKGFRLSFSRPQPHTL